MNGNERVLYPMLGVGAFFAAFWAGVVVGYELGLSCFGLLLYGFGFALLAALLVAKLERRDLGARADPVGESMEARSRRRPAVESGVGSLDASRERASESPGRPRVATRFITSARRAFGTGQAGGQRPRAPIFR